MGQRAAEKQAEAYEDHATDVDDDYNYLSTWTVYEGGVCTNTDILLSPSVIGMGEVAFKPFATLSCEPVKDLALTFTVKGVGKQYLDNTSSPDRLVPAYYVCDLSLTDTIPLKAGSLTLGFYAGNFTNHLYYTGGGAWKQTIYWPLMQASRLGRGQSLQTKIICDKASTAHYDDVPYVDAAAVLDRDGGVTIFAVNRDLSDSAELALDLRMFAPFKTVQHSVLRHDDLKAVNTEACPDTVKPCDVQADLKDGSVLLPPASWNVIRLIP